MCLECVVGLVGLCLVCLSRYLCCMALPKGACTIPPVVCVVWFVWFTWTCFMCLSRYWRCVALLVYRCLPYTTITMCTMCALHGLYDSPESAWWLLRSCHRAFRTRSPRFRVIDSTQASCPAPDPANEQASKCQRRYDIESLRIEISTFHRLKQEIIESELSVNRNLAFFAGSLFHQSQFNVMVSHCAQWGWAKCVESLPKFHDFDTARTETHKKVAKQSSLSDRNYIANSRW